MFVQVLAKANIRYLLIAQALGFAMVPMLMLVAALIGQELSGSSQLATLPVAMMVIGTALGAMPMALLMQRFGRRPVLVAAALAMSAVLYLTSWTLLWQSFIGFCACLLLLGVGAAALQQFRFVAMESVIESLRPAATSALLLAGVLAANLGPQVALWAKDWGQVEYQGGFYCASLGFILVALVLSRLSETSLVDKELPLSDSDTDAPANEVAIEAAKPKAQPLVELLSNTSFWLAVLAAAVGFALMSLIMTATPISMHHHGFDLEETKWVIQSHISAMFLPSLITPWLIQRLGFKAVMAAGLVIYLLCIGIGFSGFEFAHYWSSLVLLGIGWNFLFVAGTSYLPQTYRPEMAFKAQALNDSLVFACQAAAALAAGWLLAVWGWQMLLLSCIPACVLLLGFIAYMHLKQGSSS